jgi:hypothetical protein
MAENTTQRTQAEKEAIDKAVVENLSKSFSTGYGITPETQHDAAALRRELLDDEVKMLAFDNSDFTIYPAINKRQVTSTVFQYAVFNQHGRTGHSRFVREVGVADVNDPNIRQKTVRMKFLSDTKQQTIAAGLVNNISDPMTILTEDAISVIAKSIEWAIFYGDAELSDDIGDNQGGIEFDGLVKLIDQKTNVMDIRGRDLTEADLNKAAVIVGKGYGRITDAFMPIGVQAQFTNTLLERQRVIQPSQQGGFSTGFAVNQFLSTRGAINLHGSTIMENDNVLDETRIPKQNAPLPPQDVTATVKTGAKGLFGGDNETGTHSYKVVVFSDEAESKASPAVEAAVTAADSAVELTITLQPMYQAKPQFVNVYRQGKTTGNYFLIARIPASKMNDQNQIVFTDRNETIPETTDIFAGEMSPQVISLLELLPMMRLPLAQMNAATTFTVLWYGALALYAPKKWVRIKNVRYIPAMAADVNVQY